MRVYLIVFIVTFLIQFIPVKNNKQYLRRVLLTFIPLFLFGALRVDFGLDYPAYEAEFQYAHIANELSDVSGHSEIGYVVLETIVPTWRLLIVLTTALTCFAYGLLFYKCVPYKYSWMAVCILFLCGQFTIFFQFSGIRNAIAIAIFLLSFPLIRDKKLIPFLVLLFLAFSFHSTAIFFMPLAYILCRSNDMGKTEAWFWVIVMIILQVTGTSFLFERFSGIIDAYFSRYDAYFSNIEIEESNRLSLPVRSFVAIVFLLMIYFMRTTNLTSNENVICRVSLIYILSYLLGPLSGRLPQCYGFMFVCGATLVLYKWKSIFEKYAFGIVVFVYLAYAFFIVWMGRDQFPYSVYHSVFMQ